MERVWFNGVYPSLFDPLTRWGHPTPNWAWKMTRSQWVGWRTPWNRGVRRDYSIWWYLAHQLKALPRASLVWKSKVLVRRHVLVYQPTQYMMGVQPSIVTHWKVVSMARPMLSKEVIPGNGNIYFQFSLSKTFYCTFIRAFPLLQAYRLIKPEWIFDESSF